MGQGVLHDDASRRPRTPVWLIAALAGAACVATGALPWHDAVATTDRIGPILGFLAAITVVAELADAAQVFDVAALRAARLGRGHTRGLFCLVLLLGTLTTVVLSLDTTAVLLTPVEMAEALSETRMVTTSPVRLARSSRAASASRPVETNNDPGEGPVRSVLRMAR